MEHNNEIDQHLKVVLALIIIDSLRQDRITTEIKDRIQIEVSALKIRTVALAKEKAVHRMNHVEQNDLPFIPDEANHQAIAVHNDQVPMEVEIDQVDKKEEGISPFFASFSF